MQKGETKALLCTDVNRSSHGPGPPTCYLQTPWATGSHALQLCNECALGLPRSRRAARGSLLVLFFFFSFQHPNFCSSDPRPAPRTGSCRLVGCGVGVGVGELQPQEGHKVTEDASRGRGSGEGPGRSGPGARGGKASPTHPRTRPARGTRSRPVPAPPRPPGEFTTPKQILTESVPFSQMMDVFSVWPPGRWGPDFPACLAGPTSRRASRCPGRSREEGLLPAVSAAATWGRGGRKAAEEKCVCVCF